MFFNSITQDNKIFDKEFPPTMDPVIFQSEGEKIIGTMFVANGPGPHPTIILLHGFPGNETNFDLAHSFRRDGYNVFIFHYRGSWGSSGEFSFANGIKDTENAIEFLKSPRICESYRIDSSDIRIIGYSMGGFFGMYNGLKIDEIKNIAFVTGFNFGLFSKLIPTIDNAKELTKENLKKGSQILSKTDPDKLYQEMVSNSEEWDLINHTDKMRDKNLLFISALYDTIAPIEIHHRPLTQAMSAKKINYVEHILESGHGLANTRIELATILLDWLNTN